MPDLWIPEDTRELADDARRMIRQRTAAGIGADGQPFAPLEDGSPSRLRQSGAMLDGLRVEGRRFGAAVVADADYARYVDAKRPFMALTDDELPELDRRVEQLLDRREAGWGGEP